MVNWNSKLTLATTNFSGQVQATYWPLQANLISPQPQIGDALFISNNTQEPFDWPKSSIVNSLPFLKQFIKALPFRASTLLSRDWVLICQR